MKDASFFVDTHCHLHLMDNWEEVLKRAIDNGVKKIWIPCVTPDDMPLILKIYEKYQENVVVMVGLHPLYVDKYGWVQQLKKVEDWLSKDDGAISMVGEIGMDFYKGGDKEAQRSAFKTQVIFAIEGNLPVSIHRRNATKDVLDAIAEVISEKGLFRNSLLGVFHCFNREDIPFLEKMLSFEGLYLGAGGILTRKSETKALESLKDEKVLKRMVLETDSPYLPPEGYSYPNEPAMIPVIAKFICEKTEREEAEIINITTENALSLCE